MKGHALALLTLGVLVGIACPAQAGEPANAADIEAETDTPQVAHGELVEPCAWPTVVSVEGASLCTGTLIHPRVVVYAAHCGGELKTLRFGEQSLAGGRSVSAERCAAYPAYAGDQDQGHDWAYCVLPEAITELPLAPPLFGCEAAALYEGVDVAIVGYGLTEAGDTGLARWATTALVALTPGNNTALVGNPGVDGTPSLCSGDSGGPGFVRLEDGSWRTFGVASTSVGECGGYGAFSLLPAALAWLEADSGFDLTPCHTADGGWAPGPACAGFYAAAANVGAGSWEDWCSETPATGASSVCGPAWDDFDPGLKPSVEIVAPESGEVIASGIELEVGVDALKHPEGFAVARVQLELDGEVQAVDEDAPWRFALALADGDHELVAIAEDWAGNVVRSTSVAVSVGEGGDGESGDGESSGSASDGPQNGCNCRARASTVRLPGLLLLGFVGIARRRRRRAAK